MFGTWQEETSQTRKRKLHGPLYYVGVGIALATAFWWSVIVCSLVGALMGH